MSRSSRLDDRIESLLKPTVYRMMGAAEHTVASRRRARQYVRRLLRSNSEQRKQTLVNRYADDALSRRRFLKLLGVGAIGAAAGVGSADLLKQASQRQRTPTGNAAANTVHAVDDLGWDPNGNTSIHSSLGSAYGSDTTIQVPPGTYRVSDTAFTNGSASNFTLEGLGESHRDVQFVLDQGFRGIFMDIRGGGGPHTLRNFSVQQRDDADTGCTINVKVRDGMLIEDVEHLGFTPDDGEGSAGNNMALAVETRNGTGAVRRYYNRQGGIILSYPNRSTGVWISGSHTGTLTVQDTVIMELGGSAIYGTRHNGTVRVEGGYYWNNDHHELRVSNERQDQDAWVRGVVMGADYSMLQHDKADSHEAGEGYWLEHGTAPILIEDCDVLYRDPYPTAEKARGDEHFPAIFAIRGGGKGYNAEITFRNCRIENSLTDDNPVTGPSIRAGGGTGPVTVEQCHFTGSSSEAAVASSTDCEVIDCCINMPNGGTISGATTRNVQRGGSCDSPDLKELDAVYEGANAPSTGSYGSGGETTSNPC